MICLGHGAWAGGAATAIAEVVRLLAFTENFTTAFGGAGLLKAEVVASFLPFLYAWNAFLKPVVYVAFGFFFSDHLILCKSMPAD
ncbi:hypothetical protein Nepgr_017488 [Nepenthes gracilis]|uniref:Uncharacterized protein n=1 Tax=Nepenthes gracilis TaxID=150966 RepID=A0AAD3SSG7_NEPGR|nr:hypothetical protein Nepgr_017488 [Nepenthes gracilis]